MIFNNESIHHIAGRIRVTRLADWQERHPQNGLDTLLWRVYTIIDKGTNLDSNALIEALGAITKRITDLDKRITFNISHMLWVMNAAHNKDVLAFEFMRYLIEREEDFVTCRQAAQISNEAPTTWRTRIVKNEIAGVRKVGNTLVFPAWVVK